MIWRRIPDAYRRVLLDWVVPIGIFITGVVNVSRMPHSTEYPGKPGEHLVFLAIGVAALGVRRRAPLLAPIAAIAVVTWWSSVMWSGNEQGPFEGFLVLVGAAYCIGALNTGRRFWIAGGIVVVTFVVGQIVVLAHGGRDGDLLPVAVWMAGALIIGQLISRRTEQAHQARAAAAVLAADQERQTQRAVEDERTRIARELHDVVAHSLSVIVVQASAERRMLPPGVESVDGALGSIEKAGREALVDLRRLLGLLRKSDEPAALAPQPGLDQVEELLAPVRAAGVHVELAISGEAASLPAGLDLTVYRIVQEALTNVLKHADAQQVRVALDFRRGHLDLEVTDDGVPRSTSLPGAGHGLIGMRERVSVFGGTISTGPRPDSAGWTVRARLPMSQSVPA
jgi:signal transduction histidine kinase